MNDPSSAREFRNVARDPLLQSGPAAGEEALIEIKSAVLAKLVLAVGKDAGSATDRDWFLAAASPSATASSIAGWPRSAPATPRAASASTISRSNS